MHGRGFFGPEFQTIGCHFKTTSPSTLKLCEFLFLSFDYTVTKYQQDPSTKGVAVVFLTRAPEYVKYQ